MPWGLEHYKKYPFTAQPGDFPQLFVEKPIFVVAKSPELSKKVIEILRSAVLEGRIPLEVAVDHEESLILYYSLLSIARMLNDKRVINRIALAYAKTTSSMLEEEDEEVLLILGTKLGLKVVKPVSQFTPTLPSIVERGKKSEIVLTPLKYAIPVDEYVGIVSKRLAHDPTYALANTIVSGGQVYLDRRAFQRVLEEHVFNTIVQFAESLPTVNAESVQELLNAARDIIAGVYREHSRETGTSAQQGYAATSEEAVLESRTVEAYYPPCIKRIIDIMNTGGNPSHLERFTLAAFLGQIGLDVDDILEYFRKTADFNEKIARYQVEHILGLRGGKRKYMPYNCENLKAMNICPISEQCPGGKNPVAVYKHNLRKAGRKKAKTEQNKVQDEEGKAAGGI